MILIIIFIVIITMIIIITRILEEFTMYKSKGKGQSLVNQGDIVKMLGV